MKLAAVGLSDKGKKRENNEDSLFVDDQRGLYIVCDGMGGHASGEVASRRAIEEIAKYLQERETEWKGWLHHGQHDAIHKFFLDAIENISQTLFQYAKDHPESRGMGTTLTLLAISQNKGILAHVGDSRLYLVRNGHTYQLSQDHTLLQELMTRGLVSSEDSKDHPHRHVLLRSLGTQPSALADTLVFDIFPEDKFLLCSDGLSGYFEDTKELSALFQAHSAKELPKILVDLANERGGQDNISAIVVHAEYADALDTLEEKAEQAWGHQYLQMLQYLQESYLCKDLQMREILRLLNLCKRIDFPDTNASVIEEGKPSAGLYLLLEGTCQISQEGRFARTLQPGHQFGDAALLDDLPVLETVRTLESVALLHIDREDFLTFTRRRPRLGHKLIRNVANELNRRWRLLKEIIADLTREGDKP